MNLIVSPTSGWFRLEALPARTKFGWIAHALCDRRRLNSAPVACAVKLHGLLIDGNSNNLVFVFACNKPQAFAEMHMFDCPLDAAVSVWKVFFEDEA